jgi:hypothetical protein
LAYAVNECEQSCWAYLFAEGLIDRKTANLWADEVWRPSDEETDEEADL